MTINSFLRLPMLVVVLLSPSVCAFAQGKPHPYFQATTQSKISLLTQALKLRKGDPADAVLKAMGKPAVDQVLSKKESDKIVGRELRYYLVRWEDGLVNELHDETISVWLDPSNLVKTISIKAKLFNE